MGVGDVEPHAPGAGGADLDVDAGAGVDHAAVHDLDVADQARHVEGVEQALGGGVLDAPRLELLQDVLGRAEDVAVGDAGRGVDAVDHDVRPRLGEDVVEDEGVEVLVVEAAQLGADEVALGRPPGAGRRCCRRRWRAPSAPASSWSSSTALLGLLDAQAVDLDLARPARQQLPADGRADQAVPSEHKDLPILNVQRPSPSMRDWMPDVDSTLAGGLYRGSRGRTLPSHALPPPGEWRESRPAPSLPGREKRVGR